MRMIFSLFEAQPTPMFHSVVRHTRRRNSSTCIPPLPSCSVFGMSELPKRGASNPGLRQWSVSINSTPEAKRIGRHQSVPKWQLSSRHGSIYTLLAVYFFERGSGWLMRPHSDGHLLILTQQAPIRIALFSPAIWIHTKNRHDRFHCSLPTIRATSQVNNKKNLCWSFIYFYFNLSKAMISTSKWYASGLLLIWAFE